MLYLGTGPRGRGVFTDVFIEQNSVVERCPAIKLSLDNSDPALMEYVFRSRISENYLMVLGYGMMYNHSSKPNLSFVEELGDMVFRATRDIQADEELLDDYGADWWSSFGKTPIEISL